jgi:hypothetical protein
MENWFAGHSHDITPHLVDGCPLCDAAKTARNRAIEHLSEALYLLAGLRQPGDRPTIRLNLAPIGISGDDIARCHSIDLSAKQAEALSDAIDSMNAYAGSEGTENLDVDHASLARRKTELMAWMEAQGGEAIESGEWSAAAVAQHSTDLWDAVNDVFADLHRVDVGNEILRDRQADLERVSDVLDEVLPYPFAEEDVPLPHDQAQMDALTAEAEKFLQDGGE